MDSTPGQRITAPFLSAPAVVKAFEPRSGYYRLQVVLQDASHTYQTLRITDQQLAQVQLDGQSGLTQLDDPEELSLHNLPLLNEQCNRNVLRVRREEDTFATGFIGRAET